MYNEKKDLIVLIKEESAVKQFNCGPRPIDDISFSTNIAGPGEEPNFVCWANLSRTGSTILPCNFCCAKGATTTIQCQGEQILTYNHKYFY